MTLSTRQIRLLAAFAGINILLVLGGWMTLVSPQRHDAATAAAAAQLAQTQLDVLNGVNSSPGPAKQPEIHTADLYSLDTALPSQADQPNLLLELDRMAKAAGVDVLSISPQTGQASANGYTAVPISLSVNGTYFKLTTFLRNLRMLVAEQHGRLVAHGPLFAVTAVTFSPGTGKGHEVPATVSLEAFYYGVTAGASAPASTTATDTTTTTGG
jgi:hypothetical protein